MVPQSQRYGFTARKQRGHVPSFRSGGCCDDRFLRPKNGPVPGWPVNGYLVLGLVSWCFCRFARTSVFGRLAPLVRRREVAATTKQWHTRNGGNPGFRWTLDAELAVRASISWNRQECLFSWCFRRLAGRTFLGDSHCLSAAAKRRTTKQWYARVNNATRAGQRVAHACGGEE